jgi:uracil-DNA glycosylase family protein
MRSHRRVPDADLASAAPRSAADLIPPETLAKLRAAAAHCTACSLHARATQTVFGEGPEDAPLVLVGEQPGDQEDRVGRPFVGPAGQLLDRCLAAAGIDRGKAYVTNVVKHFKWVPRGKRRIHGKPNAREIQACKPWLEAEIAVVKPKVLVCLGATAAQALLGPSFRVSRDRGRLIPSALAPYVLATVHPSALLRARDEEREAAIARFIADLAEVAPLLARERRTPDGAEPSRSAARHRELDRNIATGGVRIRADLLMRLLGEGRELRLRQALVLDAQAHGEAEAAALARPDRHGAGDLRLARVLLLLLGDEVERAAEASGVSGGEQMLGRGGARPARPAHGLRYGQIGLDRAVACLGVPVAPTGCRGRGGE